MGPRVLEMCQSCPLNTPISPELLGLLESWSWHYSFPNPCSHHVADKAYTGELLANIC